MDGIFKKIDNKKTLNILIYENLKEMILTSKLKPGDKLNETTIADQLGVSATPVREAFRNLSSEGLVKIISYRGVFVSEFTEEEIKDTYQCREALECLALELAFPNLNEDSLFKLKKQLNKANESSDISKTIEVNNYLHNTIIEKSNNEKLKQILDQLAAMLLHDKSKSAYNPSRRTEIYLEHIDIVDALIDGDLEKAKALMSAHIRGAYKYVSSERRKGI